MQQGEQHSLLVETIIEAMQEKKALDICILYLKEVNATIADYFILCSGSSPTHIEAITEGIIRKSRQLAHQKPWKKEGFFTKEWMILDYVHTVVHIFQAEKRHHYALESLWGDATLQHR